jgi:hypothetical protein
VLSTRHKVTHDGSKRYDMKQNVIPSGVEESGCNTSNVRPRDPSTSLRCAQDDPD